METPKIGERVKFWQEQDRNKSRAYTQGNQES